jgi:hypothetical protein
MGKRGIDNARRDGRGMMMEDEGEGEGEEKERSDEFLFVCRAESALPHVPLRKRTASRRLSRCCLLLILLLLLPLLFPHPVIALLPSLHCSCL